MKFYVYLIKSIDGNHFYIGQTQDLNERLIKHNLGKVLSTRKNCPWKIEKYEEYPTRKEARYREYKLKHSAWQRKKFIGE